MILIQQCPQANTARDDPAAQLQDSGPPELQPERGGERGAGGGPGHHHRGQARPGQPLQAHPRR